MYVIDKYGIRAGVVESGNGYMLYLGTNLSYFMKENDFIDKVESGLFRVICDDPDEEECQCEVCQAERGLFDEDEDDFIDDIREELYELKSEMEQLRDIGMFEEYHYVAQSYALLYKLLI